MKVVQVKEVSKTEGVASHFSLTFFSHSTPQYWPLLKRCGINLLEITYEVPIHWQQLCLITFLSFLFFSFGDSNMEVGTSGECSEHLWVMVWFWRTECWMLSLRRLMGTLSPGLLSHPPPASCSERRMTTTCCGGKLELVSALFHSFRRRFIVHFLIVELCSWGYGTDGLVSSSLASSKLTNCLSSKPPRGRLRRLASPVPLRGLDNVYSVKYKVDSQSVQTGTVHLTLNLRKVTFIGLLFKAFWEG